MQQVRGTARDGHAEDQRWKAVVLVAGWFVLVMVTLSRHVFWRDEVRALSLALQGDGVIGMLRALHGEGHPALWYLLLRGASAVLPTTAVLPTVSVAVALAALMLLVRRSPFGCCVIALIALGRPMLYEYSVMARNYGISMLLMFAFAALYARRRDRGWALGAVLFLLANCNVHSAIIAGAFCLFWGLDLLLARDGLRPGTKRNYALNVVLATAGVAVCAATIYPPFNDLAQLSASDRSLFVQIKSLVLPSIAFPGVAGYRLWGSALEGVALWRMPYTLVVHATMSAVMLGSVIGLATRPAALIAAAAALLGLSVFFSMIYAGGFRHQALWLMFLVSLYWIARTPRPGAMATAEGSRAPEAARRIHALGFACFIALLAIQVVLGVAQVYRVAVDGMPESRSRDVAGLVAQRPGLKDAVVVAEPDYLVEALPQYIPNRTYLLRERRFGNVVIFTRKARRTLSLGEMLADARRLRETTGEPVVLLLEDRLDPEAPALSVRRSYDWTFTATPQEVAEFLAATRRIARFAPACCTDESFDVYVLDR